MTSPRCIVGMYHYVRDVTETPFPDVKALSPVEFEAQLDVLASNCAVVHYSTFAGRVHERVPLDRPSALLTFDDGFLDHFETVFPALAARGWSGVFFLAGQTLDDPPHLLNVHKTHFLIARLGAQAFAEAVHDALAREPIDAGRPLGRTPDVYRYDRAADLDAKHLLNYELPCELADRVLDTLFADHLGDEAVFARSLYLSPDHVAGMARAGMTFGFHTERHRVLSRLDAAQQRAELSGGVARIQVLTGQTAVPFCYPYGHPHTYNPDTLSLLDQLGYDLAFNTVRRLADPAADSRFEVPRYDTRDLPPFTAVLPDA